MDGEKNVEKKKEKEEKKKRREEEKEDPKRYGTLYIFVWIHVCGLWIVGCEKPNPKMNSCMEIITNPFDLFRVLLEFHHNLRFLKSRVGKTLNGTRKTWNPPFEVGFMV